MSDLVATGLGHRAGGHSIGYKQQVVLPLRIVAKAADKPVTLRADIHYAVCDKLCIPVEATSELTFASVASTEDGTLSAALDSVPKPANIGDPNPVTLRDVKRDGKANVLVDVTAPEGKKLDLFVEALPALLDAAGYIARVSIHVTGTLALNVAENSRFSFSPGTTSARSAVVFTARPRHAARM